MTRAEKIAVGRIQDLIGRASHEMNDRNPHRAAQVESTLHEAFSLAVGLLSRSAPITCLDGEEDKVVSPLLEAVGYEPKMRT
jgi:hypothetical protein